MRKIFTVFLLFIMATVSVQAAEFEPPEVPMEAERYLPEESRSFGEDFWHIVKQAIADILPEVAEAAGICFSVIAVFVFTSVLNGTEGRTKKTIDLVAVVATSLVLTQPSRALLSSGILVITDITEYGKLLSPVMAGALAAQGGIASSGALYIGTTVFNAILGVCIRKLIVPMLYVFIVLCIACNAIGEKILKNLRDLAKWLMTWFLKIVIYVFTGYMTITGVVGGCTDAAALKAAKLTITGVIPIVGNIISDASDAVLSSTAVIKNSVGIYGLLAVIALWIAPFLRVGIHYLLLKLTASICATLDPGPGSTLVGDYCTVMGYVMALISLASLLVLISTVCFMKGVS